MQTSSMYATHKIVQTARNLPRKNNDPLSVISGTNLAVPNKRNLLGTPAGVGLRTVANKLPQSQLSKVALDKL